MTRPAPPAKIMWEQFEGQIQGLLGGSTVKGRITRCGQLVAVEAYRGPVHISRVICKKTYSINPPIIIEDVGLFVVFSKLILRDIYVPTRQVCTDCKNVPHIYGYEWALGLPIVCTGELECSHCPDLTTVTRLKTFGRRLAMLLEQINCYSMPAYTGRVDLLRSLQEWVYQRFSLDKRRSIREWEHYDMLREVL